MTKPVWRNETCPISTSASVMLAPTLTKTKNKKKIFNHYITPGLEVKKKETKNKRLTWPSMTRPG